MNSNKKYFRNFGTIMIMPIISCVLSACNSGNGTGATSSTSAVTQSGSKVNSAPLGDTLYTMRMGSGIDSVTHTGTSGQTCLANASNQDNIYIGYPSASVSLNSQQSMNELQQALNVDVSGPYGGDRFSTSMAAQFANSSKNTSYTANFLYLSQYASKAVFKDGSLGNGLDALTPSAAALAQTSPTDFRSICGNEFVEQMDAGAVLGVRLTLKFNSHLDQESFLAQMNATTGLSSISEEIKQAAANSNVAVEVSLSAIQQGGQPEKLSAVFAEAGSSSSYPSTQCVVEGSADTTTCDTTINNLIAYSQTLDEQLTNSDGSLKLDALYYTNPAFTPYSNLGISTQGAADPSAEVLGAMEQLVNDYDQAVYNHDFSSHYVTNLSGKLDTATTQNLNDTSQKLNNQINNVYLVPVYDVIDCYKGYVTSQCLTIRDNVEEGLVPYALSAQESSLIDYLENNAYSGYLMNYYGGATPTATDYHMSNSECTFAPVSSPNYARYAINCNGQWLTTEVSKGIIIQPSYLGEGLNVSDLAYISTPPNTTTNGQLISYYDSVLSLDDSYDNYFYNDAVGISAPQYTTNTAELDLFKLYQNPA